MRSFATKKRSIQLRFFCCKTTHLRSHCKSRAQLCCLSVQKYICPLHIPEKSGAVRNFLQSEYKCRFIAESIAPSQTERELYTKLRARKLRTVAAKKVKQLPYILLKDPEQCETIRFYKVDCDGQADRRCGGVDILTIIL